jgi:hypothetical protein
MIFRATKVTNTRIKAISCLFFENFEDVNTCKVFLDRSKKVIHAHVPINLLIYLQDIVVKKFQACLCRAMHILIHF